MSEEDVAAPAAAHCEHCACEHAEACATNQCGCACCHAPAA